MESVGVAFAVGVVGAEIRLPTSLTPGHGTSTRPRQMMSGPRTPGTLRHGSGPVRDFTQAVSTGPPWSARSVFTSAHAPRRSAVSRRSPYCRPEDGHHRSTAGLASAAMSQVHGPRLTDILLPPMRASSCSSWIVVPTPPVRRSAHVPSLTRSRRALSSTGQPSRRALSTRGLIEMEALKADASDSLLDLSLTSTMTWDCLLK